MATVTQILSTKVDQRGKSEILLRFVGGRGYVFRLHSRIYVKPERWKDGAIIIPRIATREQQDLKDTKQRVDCLITFLLDEFSDADKTVVTKEWMQEAVERFHHPDRKGLNLDFFKTIEQFYDTKDVSSYRRKRYRVTIEALRRFELVRGKPLTIRGIDASVLEEFRHFLINEHQICQKDDWRKFYEEEKVHPGKRGKNAIIGYFTVIRTFYHWLNKTGIYDGDPFKAFHIGQEVYGTPYYLTIEERDAIYGTDLSDNPHLQAQRDIFIFQCLVGCRVGDLLRFRKGDVADGFLSYIPRKTREGHPVVVRVPLSATAAEIVGRYADFKGEQLLPFISSQKYDEAIKEIFTRAGITRAVTILDPLTRQEVKKPFNKVASSHLARRTFIGNLYRQVKDPALIGSMTGHVEGSRAFSRYRDIDDDIKSEIVRLLDKK